MKRFAILIPLLFLVGCQSVSERAASLQKQQEQQATEARAMLSELGNKIASAQKYLAATQPTQSDIESANAILVSLSIANGPLAALSSTINSIEDTARAQSDLATAADAALAKERGEFWSYRQRRGFVWLCVIIVAVVIGVVLLRVASNPAANAALGPVWSGAINALGHLLTGFFVFIFKGVEWIVSSVAKLTGRVTAAIGTRVAPVLAKAAPTPDPVPQTSS